MSSPKTGRLPPLDKLVVLSWVLIFLNLACHSARQPAVLKVLRGFSCLENSF